MRRPHVDVQAAQHGPAQWVMGQHALYGVFNDSTRALIHLLLHSQAAEAAWIAGVPVVALLDQLVVAGHADFLCINHNNGVTGIQVWNIQRIEFAFEQLGNLRC